MTPVISTTTTSIDPIARSRSLAPARVLVTGAAGLLGRELAATLATGGQAVRGIDLAEPGPRWPPDRWVSGDLRSDDACRQACDGVSAVIHAAARQHHSRMPRRGRERFFHANVTMTRTILRAAVEAGVGHFIDVSSDMVYGMPRGRPFVETDVPCPIGPYGRSKLEGEAVCAAARGRSLIVTILRPRLIVGPGRLGVLTRLFDRVRRGRAVPVFGPGHHRYQMVAVADVASACAMALARPCDGVLNLGSDDPPTVRELLGDLCRRAGTTSRIVSMPCGAANAALWALHAVRLAPLSPEQFRIAGADYVLDTTRAREQLGWRPRFSDAEMLWQAYRAYLETLGAR